MIVNNHENGFLSSWSRPQTRQKLVPVQGELIIIELRLDLAFRYLLFLTFRGVYGRIGISCGKCTWSPPAELNVPDVAAAAVKITISVNKFCELPRRA
jgi:hypothetical protein